MTNGSFEKAGAEYKLDVLFLARDPHWPRVLRTLTLVLPKPLALSELVSALVGLLP